MAELKRVNVGGYANFYTGGASKLIGEPHPRGRIYIYDEDIVDQIDDPNYIIQTVNAIEPADESKEPQNTVSENKGIGIVYCSYILGYAFSWEFFRGLKRIVKVKKNDEAGTQYEIETQRFDQVSSAQRIQLQFVDGVKVNAPKLSQQKRKKGEKSEIELTGVSQLSVGVPSLLIDKDGKYIRLSKKPVKKDEQGKEGKPIGLGISENYFDEFLAKSEILSKVVASYNIAAETLKNLLRPKLDFTGELKGGETLLARSRSRENVIDAELVEAQLILPPAKTVWAGNSVGAIVGIKNNVIPMRVPAYEIHQLFEDML